MDCWTSLNLYCSSSRLTSLLLPPPNLQTDLSNHLFGIPHLLYFLWTHDCGVQFSFPLMQTGPPLHSILEYHSRPDQRPQLHLSVRPFPHVVESWILGCAVKVSKT